jgi:hypothetical protein
VACVQVVRGAAQTVKETVMRRIVLGVLVTATMAAPAAAQTAPAAPAPAPKKVTVVVGADAPSMYMFRGIRQEFDANFTLQPFVDVGIAAAPNVTVNFGSWNSFNTGSSGSGTPGLGAWYESDVYGSVTVTKGKWKPGLLFTSYTSPNDVFKTVNELAGVVSYDDSAKKVPLSPKVILGFELTDGQADGGANKGIYFEAGIRPSFKPGGSSVTIGVPLKLGMSAKDYYEGPSGDSKFGYFDIGLAASVPLSKMKAGAWELHGGVDVFTFGDTLKAFNDGDKARVVGSVGFTITY